MAYASISFTAFEVPTAAKWNILGTNDAEFNSMIKHNGTIVEVAASGDTSIDIPVNNIPLRQDDSGGTPQNVAKVNSSNYLEIGDADLAGVLVKNIVSCKVYRNAALSLATGATIVFDTEVWDDGADHNTGTGIFTVPIAGTYLVSSIVTWATPTDAKRYGHVVYLDAVIMGNTLAYARSTSQMATSQTCVFKATAGQEIKIVASHDHGSALSLTVGLGGTQMQVLLIGAA